MAPKIDDLMAFMLDRNLPVDEIEAANIADEIMVNPPLQGFLTISNALQWRLQYGRVIEQASATRQKSKVKSQKKKSLLYKLFALFSLDSYFCQPALVKKKV
jgi:hypothetical protein